GMKRQRSRNRKPSGNSNNPNRAYESNGPEGTKVRGNAQTIYEKYQQMARDANSSGDRVLAENHLQHAEHYFRLIRQMQPTRPVSEFVQRDPFSNGFDFDEDDMDGEGGENEATEASAEGADTQPVMDDARADNRYDNRRDNRTGGDRMNGERNNNGERVNGFNGGDRNGNRDRNNRDRDRNNGNRNNGERGFEPRSFEPRDRINGAAANGGGREFEPREGDADGLNGERRETRRERYERRRAQRLSEQEYNLNGGGQVMNGGAVNGEIAAPAFIASTEPLGAKPVRTPAAEAVTTDASHLPAFLHKPAPTAPLAEASAEDAPAKPKRGRPKRKAEEVSAEDA
ncbi:MAG: DUF4167 domain-containing protein, partial [Asticcacaulis sp.]